MTPELAIRILSDDTPGTISQIQEAVKMGAEALVSRIPRKIEMKEDKFGMSYHLYCPACGTYFGTRGKHSIWIGSKPAYCDCGQRLDWSDVDDNIPK